MKFKNSDVFKKLGLGRYLLVLGLFLTMMFVVLKIVLRIAPPVFGAYPVKYIWVTPWFNV
jgi:hypothetical protein